MLSQPRTTFANGVNPFGVYKPPKPKTKERRPYVHIENSKPAQRVLAYIRDHPGVFAKDLRRELPIRAIYNYITALERDGYINTVLTPQGPHGVCVKQCFLNGEKINESNTH